MDDIIKALYTQGYEVTSINQSTISYELNLS